MKKMIAFFLALIIIASFPLQSFASVEKQIIYKDEEYKFSLLEQRADYEKIKIENKDTGEIEYVESYLGDLDNPEYKITTPTDVYNIKSNNIEKQIIIKNLTTGETEKYKTEDLFNDLGINIVEDDDKSEIAKNSKVDINKKIIKPTSPSTKSSWSYMSHLSGRGSRKETISDVGMLASLLAAPFSGGASLFLGVASWYISKKVTDIFYHLGVYTKIENSWLWRKDVIKYYSNSSYSKIVETVNTQPRKWYRAR